MKLKDWLAIFFLFFLTCLFLFKVVFFGKVLLPADLLLRMYPWRSYSDQFPEFEKPYNPLLDPIQQYYPWRVYAANAIRKGFIPLWNPHQFSGTPFVANLQSAVFYPLNFLFYVFPPERAFGYSALLHLFLAGLFMFLFLRTLPLSLSLSTHQSEIVNRKSKITNLSSLSALLGAIIFAFSGFFVVWLEYPTFISVGIWLPLILFLYEKAIQRRSWNFALFTAIPIGLQFLAGHLQISFYVLFAFLTYAVFRTIQESRKSEVETLSSTSYPPAALGSPLLALAFALLPLLLGFLLSCLQILPTLELVKYSARAGRGSYEAILGSAMPFSYLITLLIPNFFGHPVDYNYWAAIHFKRPINYIEFCGYVGILPLFLALIAIFLKKDKTAYFFAGLWIFSILIALGTHLNALFFYLVPGFGKLPGISRILYLHCFATASLAAVGTELVTSPLEKKERKIIRLLCLIAFLGLIGLLVPVINNFFWILQAPEISKYEINQLIIFIVCLFCALICILLALKSRRQIAKVLFLVIIIPDLFLFGLKFNPASDPKILHISTDFQKFMKKDKEIFRIVSLGRDFLRRLPPNLPTIFQLQDIQGSDSLYINRYVKLMESALPEMPSVKLSKSNFYWLNLLNVKYIITPEELLETEALKLVHNRDVRIYLNRGYLPRAFLVWRTLPAQISVPWTTLRESAILTEEETIPPLPKSSPKFRQAKVIRYSPNQVVIKTNCDKSSLLVLSDTYYPGWKAYLDGKKTKIYLVNYILRAIYLDKGKHEINFIYQPNSYKLGLFLALCALLSLTTSFFVGAPFRVRCL